MRSDGFALAFRTCTHLAVALVALAASTACDPGPAVPDDETYAPVFQSPGCSTNNDDSITADELPFVVGAVARVRVGTSVPVDLDGTIDDDGTTVWDLSRPDPSAEPVGSLEVEAMDGQWFASHFPSAQIAAPLIPGGAQLGPLVTTSSSIGLLGSASADENPAEGRSLVVYDAPATLYPLPLSPGVSSSSTVHASSATLLGLPTALTDEYDVEVVRSGRLILPDVILDHTLQVVVRFRRTLLAGDAQQVSHHFVHECLGEVARVVGPTVSTSDELPDTFDTAAEVWRLAL